MDDKSGNYKTGGENKWESEREINKKKDRRREGRKE